MQGLSRDQDVLAFQDFTDSMLSSYFNHYNRDMREYRGNLHQVSHVSADCLAAYTRNMAVNYGLPLDKCFGGASPENIMRTFLKLVVEDHAVKQGTYLTQMNAHSNYITITRVLDKVKRSLHLKNRFDRPVVMPHHTYRRPAVPKNDILYSHHRQPKEGGGPSSSSFSKPPRHPVIGGNRVDPPRPSTSAQVVPMPQRPLGPQESYSVAGKIQVAPSIPRHHSHQPTARHSTRHSARAPEEEAEVRRRPTEPTVSAKCSRVSSVPGWQAFSRTAVGVAPPALNRFGQPVVVFASHGKPIHRQQSFVDRPPSVHGRQQPHHSRQNSVSLPVLNRPPSVAAAAAAAAETEQKEDVINVKLTGDAARWSHFSNIIDEEDGETDDDEETLHDERRGGGGVSPFPSNNHMFHSVRPDFADPDLDSDPDNSQ
jgi:hypothetical protein